jgi:tungstate transport system substrate-binding protein
MSKMAGCMRWLIPLIALTVTTAHAESPQVVRLAVVNTPQYSGLLDFLLPGFQAATGMTVSVYSGNDAFQQARNGTADIVIAHYGKTELESFVLEGYGSWPKMVFANQAALIGPKNDPAGIRGLSSASEALSRIARAKAPFIANPQPGVEYLTSILWEAAGRPVKGDWFVETDRVQAAAALLAEERRGYFIWGAYPFLRFAGQRESKLEILVSEDPLLQRIMAAVIVSSQKVEGVNVEGATTLRDYLLSPQTQARIAAFRSPWSDEQLWWPAGRHN